MYFTDNGEPDYSGKNLFQCGKDSNIDGLVKEFAKSFYGKKGIRSKKQAIIKAMECLGAHLVKPQTHNSFWVREKIEGCDFHCWIELEDGKIIDYPEHILRESSKLQVKGREEKRDYFPKRIIEKGIIKYEAWYDSAGNGVGPPVMESLFGEAIRREIEENGKRATVLKYMDTSKANGTRRCGQRTTLIGMGLEEKGIKFKYCMGSLSFIDPVSGVPFYMFG